MNKYTLKTFIICLVLLLVAAVQPALGSDWAQFQKNEVHSGVTGDAAPIEEDFLDSWSAHLTSSSWSGLETAPIVGDGKIYEVAYNGEVYAYYLNGTEAWSNTAIGGSGSFELATPAYNDEDKMLYVALSKGNASTHTEIHALYAGNGTIKWSNTSLGTYQTNTPITYANDRIFFGTVHVAGSSSDAGDYYCFNASSGDMIWKRSSTTSAGYYGAGAAVIDNYLVYGDDAGHVVSVEWDNVTNGVVWKEDEINISEEFNFSGNIRSSICYSQEEGRIYFATKTGHTCSIGFNESTGDFEASNKHSVNVGYTSTPAVYNGRVYVGAGDFSAGAKLYCLNADNLTEIWNYTGSTGGVQGSPAITTYYDNANGGEDGTVYVYFTNNGPAGSLYCLKDTPDSTTYEYKWTYTPTTATYTMQGPAISNGYVFFGNDAGYLYGVYSE